MWGLQPLQNVCFVQLPAMQCRTGALGQLYTVLHPPVHAFHPLLQHGTHITLTAINRVIDQCVNAPMLELMLGSGLPLPPVPRGSKMQSIAMRDGEYGSSTDVRGWGVEGGGAREQAERHALL